MRANQYYRALSRGVALPPLFFDEFENGLGGFSFRKLLGSYSGRWGRAINIATLEERDIGFVGNVADTADILDLSNGTDTVELMAYDNSFINIYFGIQSTERPNLVTSGTLVTVGGLPAFGFDRVVQRVSMSLESGSSVDFSPVSLFSLAKINTLRQRNFSVATSSGNFGYWHGGTLTGYNGIGANFSASDIYSLSGEDLNRRLGSYFWTGSNTIKIGSNGGALATFTPTTVGSLLIRNIGVGQIASAQYFSGLIQEVLFFSANKESEEADLRSNINSFYSVY